MFDSADDPSVMRPFWPACSHGSILVSSRSPRCCEEGLAAHSIQVDPFDPIESVDYLGSLLAQSNIVPEAQHQSLQHIAAVFDGLPLGLKVAASFMKSRLLTPDKFLKLYNDRSDDFLLAAVPGTVKNLDNLWNLSLENITPEAGHLLDILCFLDGDMISTDLVGAMDDSTSPEERSGFHSALGSLFDHSLIGIINAGESIVIHKYFQTLMLRRLQSSHERYLRGLTAVLRHLSTALPPIAYIGRRPENWPPLEANLPHMRSLMHKVKGRFPDEVATTGIDVLCRYGA